MPQFRASHILVSSSEEAENLKKEIVGGKSFASVAKAHSQCPSAEEGGDLGWFEKGMMVKPFEDAVLALKVDEVSGPVRTQFGYHLIHLTGKK